MQGHSRVMRALGRRVRSVCLGALLLGCAFAAVAAPADLEQARALLVQAKGTADPDARIGLLAQSIALAPSFDAWYYTGRIYQYRGASEDAKAAFLKAKELAPDPRTAALAMARLGEATMDAGELADGLDLVRSAAGYYRAQLHADPEWERELTLKGDLARSRRIEPSRSILAALKGEQTASRLLGVALRRIDLHINFATARAEVDSTPDGLQQVEELAQAIARLGPIDQRFQLVGHTDVRGDEPYNLDLSQRRADSVKEYVATKVPSVGHLLCTSARGEAQTLQPLRTPDENAPANDDIHRVNRRVQVEIVDRCR